MFHEGFQYLQAIQCYESRMDESSAQIAGVYTWKRYYTDAVFNTRLSHTHKEWGQDIRNRKHTILFFTVEHASTIIPTLFFTRLNSYLQYAENFIRLPEPHFRMTNELSGFIDIQTQGRSTTNASTKPWEKCRNKNKKFSITGARVKRFKEE